MLPIIQNDLYKYLAVAVMLLAILFAYFKGRGAVSASGRSLAWTNVPLIAFAIASLGPSAFAIIIYLGYKVGLIQPPASGYRFSTFITGLPFDFAVMNWPFVALYLACRLRPNLNSARSAMWLSVVAMSLPNVLLFSLAWEMVSNARGAGQGIGVIEAMLMWPIVAMLWPGPLPDISDAVLNVISVFTAPIPILGLSCWLPAQLIGRGRPILDEKQLRGLRLSRVASHCGGLRRFAPNPSYALPECTRPSRYEGSGSDSIIQHQLKYKKFSRCAASLRTLGKRAASQCSGSLLRSLSGSRAPLRDRC